MNDYRYGMDFGALFQYISCMNCSKLLAAILLLLSVVGLHCEDSDDTPNPPGSVTLKDSVIVSGLNHPWEILWGRIILSG